MHAPTPAALGPSTPGRRRSSLLFSSPHYAAEHLLALELGQRPESWQRDQVARSAVKDASTTACPSNASATACRADARTTRNRGALRPLPSILTSPASPVVLLLANSSGCARVYNVVVVRPAANASSSPLPHLRLSLSSPSCSIHQCATPSFAPWPARRARMVAQMAHAPSPGGLPGQRRPP
jgi:hypothetical protein